jgi:hypothetical protein
MKLRLLSVNFVLATLLLVASATVLRAQDGAEGALAQASHTALLGQRWNRLSGPTLAIADFDGDNKQDGAAVLESAPFLPSGNFQIDLHFSGRNNASIIFQSSESDLAVGALDIDHDGDIDIVVEQSVTHKRLQVWINDGHGNFAKGHIEDFPSVVAPTRDQVMSLERRNFPAVSLPSQRGFETMLIACHVAGRPPSDTGFALAPTTSFQDDRPLSLASSRAPPLS